MDTKEIILLESLKLFARNGYEGVSVRDISGKIGMTQAALYKHYAGKQDIFDNIVKRMNDDYKQRARRLGIPDGSLPDQASHYKTISLDKIKQISQEQFLYWTQDEYASCFRKMLSLEQYRNKDMSSLYQQYFAGGIISYMSLLFEAMMEKGFFRKEDAKLAALEFYSPIYLMMDIYDGTDNKAEVMKMLKQHIDQFAINYEEAKK
ncbi:MAG: TetR/AcrR family transcriptional regulator [Bacillota bacterium]|nr:TetR/AcrR family transcriptional regulator [Bacillota bacterium]